MHVYVVLSLFPSLMCFECLSPSTGKNRRLKQAKEEAQAEIEQYRLQREKEFKTKEAAVGHRTTHTTSDTTDYYHQYC